MWLHAFSIWYTICSVEVLKYKKNSILNVFEDLYKLNDMIIRFKLV